jgi:hypothetical protein
MAMDEAGAAAQWRRCSSCKEWIGFKTLYWVCNVSTCNRKRTGLLFCTVRCWDAHLSSMNHRESWAVEKHSPSRSEWQAEQAEQARANSGGKPAERPPPQRRPVRPEPARAPAAASPDPGPSREILVVASRLKSYILARSGMNTSERVLAPLSDILRRVCDEAIENARRSERKTVLDRDIPQGR